MIEEKGLYHPPRLAIKLFQWYCRGERLEELQGDLEEFFYLRIQNGDPRWKASLFFYWNVFRCYRSYAKSKTQTTMTIVPLFKSYFKLAMRHSWKNKWSVLINIVGLGMALSMCIFVYSIYAYNLEFDSFYENSDDLYRVNAMTYENGSERRNELSPLAMDAVLRNEISQVSQVSTFFNEYLMVKKGTDYFEQEVGIASSDFFEMFDIPLWYGSLKSFGKQPVVYLTKRTAKKYFGDELALGEKLTIYLTSDRKIDVEVAGVFESIPLNSSFTMNMIISTNDYFKGAEFDLNDWGNKQYVSHYIKTSEQSIASIEAHMEQYLSLQNEGHKELKMTRFELIPFRSPIHSDTYMYRNNTNFRLGVPIYIIFTSLAGLIFLIACFNLANSSIAMIAKRLKEIGIRKTLGSESKQIMIQFLIEMGIICSLAFVIGLSTVNFTSDWIMGLFGESFQIKDVSLVGVISFIIIFLAFTTLVAGIMPALYAWKFQPINIMRRAVKLKGISWINKTLTIAQYSFSIAMLAATITFSNNLDFLENLDVGYDNEQIYAMEIRDQSLFPVISQEVSQVSGVQTAGTFNHIQRYGRSSNRRLLEIDTSSYEIRAYEMGPDYLRLMDIPIISGRSFIEGSEADEKDAVIVNEAFIDQYFSGENPIDRIVKVDGQRKTVVGVFANLIQDVYVDSEVRPTVFLYNEAAEYPYLIAKVDGADKQAYENQFKEIWNKYSDGPYVGSWQKDLAFGSAVRDTVNLRVIFFAMAILGGFLSIAGIFSLSKLNVAKRIKEISIRKVLGSSVKQLLVTINRPFVIMLSIAIVAGSLLGYLISEMVLSMIYKLYISVSPLTSILSGVFIVVLSILILTFSILTPAKSNPVIGLRED